MKIVHLFLSQSENKHQRERAKLDISCLAQLVRVLPGRRTKDIILYHLCVLSAHFRPKQAKYEF